MQKKIQNEMKKTFKELAEEMAYTSDVDNEDEYNDSEDFVCEMFEELSDEHKSEVAELIYDLYEYEIEFGDYEPEEDDELDESIISEKMSALAKTKASRLRRKPAYKKAQRKRAKCMKKFKSTIEKSNGLKTCSSTGKLIKGYSKQKRKLLAKHRKRNKNKITVK